MSVSMASCFFVAASTAWRSNPKLSCRRTKEKKNTRHEKGKKQRLKEGWENVYEKGIKREEKKGNKERNDKRKIVTQSEQDCLQVCAFTQC